MLAESGIKDRDGPLKGPSVAQWIRASHCKEGSRVQVPPGTEPFMSYSIKKFPFLDAQFVKLTRNFMVHCATESNLVFSHVLDSFFHRSEMILSEL